MARRHVFASSRPPAGCLARLAVLALGATASASDPLPRAEAPTLWYEQPAREWVEALPIGNGRLGGMVHGGPGREHLQFNEATLWTGQPRDYQHPGAAEVLPAIRRLLARAGQVYSLSFR